MTARRLRPGSVVALVSGLALSSGCATMSHATSYAADAVASNIRQDFAHGLYFAGTAHALISPLTFVAVLVGDPAARTLPPEPRPVPSAEPGAGSVSPHGGAQ